MNSTGPLVTSRSDELIQNILPQLVTISMLVWSIVKTVKLFKKFYQPNMEPAILLELIFIANFPTMLAAVTLNKLTGQSIEIDWLKYFISVMLFLVRSRSSKMC